MRRYLVLSSIALFCLVTLTGLTFAQNPFEEVAAQVGITGLGEAGVPCWFDYDRDGDLDLLRTSRFMGPVTLYINDGGEFHPLQNSGLPLSCDLQNAQPADFDRDGDLDIFFVGFHTNLQFLVCQDGFYVDRAAALGIAVDDRTRDFTWIDFDRDGFLDMLIQFEFYWKLYRNNNGTEFIDVTENAGMPDSYDNMTFAWGDYDLDGDMDMFTICYHGRDYFFRNDGNGFFTDISEQSGLIGSAANCGGVFVDMNKDKFPDLVTPGAGRHDVWLNQNGEYFIQANVHGAAADFEAMGYPHGARYAAGDYDMDGDYDLMSCSPGGTGNNGGENQFLRCDSVVGLQVWFSNMGPEYGLNTMLDGFPRFADFDDDGDLDLTILQDASSPKLYQNNINSTSRLEVQILGPNDEEDGWHRRVEIYPHGASNVVACGVLSQAAVASSGWNSYFALNDNDGYDITIHLENGLVLSPELNPQLSNVIPSVIQHKLVIRLDEVSATPQPVAQVESFVMRPAYPNPFNPSTRISFDLAQSVAVKFRVFNIIGEEVAMLNLGLKQAGSHEFEWNASALSSGVYFGKIEAGANTLTQKLVLMK